MIQILPRTISPEDLYRFQLLSECQISPDGSHVLFCVQRIDRENEKKYTNLWVVPTDGGEPWQLTIGDQADTKPRWSLDCRQIAFLSNRNDGEQPQIYLISFHGGEARQLTDLNGDFGPFEWSPDGRLVCQFRKKDREALEREQDETKKELGIVARHITRTFFKLDGTGYLPQERWHLWIVDTITGESHQLTDHPIYDELAPCWSPDGMSIAFLSNRSEDPDMDPDNTGLYVLPAESGEMQPLDTPVGYKALPTFSPDGRWLAYIGVEGRDDEWKNDSLWIVPADGSGPARNLTAPYDIHVGNGTLGDIADRPTVRPVWSPDSQRIIFQVTCHGDTLLKSMSIAGDDLAEVAGETGVIGSFSADSSGQRVAYCFGDFSDPGQMWLRDLSEDKSRCLTHFNEVLLGEVDLGEVEELWFKGADNSELQGWIVKPPGFDPAGMYPAILAIHGGPYLQYGNTFMHEFHFLAGQGYVVAFCNPRGGQGYGEEHSKVIQNNWGTADYADIMAFADFLAGNPYIDASRMGVSGGSYGGYMTSWIIGHTDRFKAAVAQRVVSNLISMWGSSDFNWRIQLEFGDRSPWEDLENYWGQSPMKHISNATTPTLVIHSEEDMRCELEQGLQLYVALKKLGVDTELVLFPGEPHGLSRSGRTDRRVARLQHMLRWFERYLKNETKGSGNRPPPFTKRADRSFPRLIG